MLTGLGIGGMLGVTNAAVAAVADAARRNLAVVLMAAGYPVGTIVGELISAQILQHDDWPAIFRFGALATLLFIPPPPPVQWGAPESIGFHLGRRGPRALEAVNRALRRFGHPLRSIGSPRPIRSLPRPRSPPSSPEPSPPPPPPWRLPLLTLTTAAMIGSVVLVIVFGQGQGDLATLSLVGGLAGFATNAGVVGLNAIVARTFPNALRVTGTGFVIGVGRGGSALAPRSPVASSPQATAYPPSRC